MVLEPSTSAPTRYPGASEFQSAAGDCVVVTSAVRQRCGWVDHALDHLEREQHVVGRDHQRTCQRWQVRHQVVHTAYQPTSLVPSCGECGDRATPDGANRSRPASPSMVRGPLARLHQDPAGPRTPRIVPDRVVANLGGKCSGTTTSCTRQDRCHEALDALASHEAMITPPRSWSAPQHGWPGTPTGPAPHHHTRRTSLRLPSPTGR